MEQTVAKNDPDPKALACYGLLLPDLAATPQVWLRFLAGRPVSAATTAFLAWGCAERAAAQKTALLLVWDNASWHLSKDVRRWLQAHNRTVKAKQAGVRIVSCFLPTKSPWLNPIEPRWVHGKRRVAEPARRLTAAEVMTRVYDAFDCEHHDQLSIPEQAA